jgi:molecular chaperone GrpE
MLRKSKKKNASMEAEKTKNPEINTDELTNPQAEITDSVNSENTEKQEIKTEEKSSESKTETSSTENFEEKYKEFYDKYLRLSAEFDNYRKRTLKERMEFYKTAGEDILTGILPVIDDFERAIKSINDAKDIQPISEGIQLIYNKFKEFLNQKGVKEIEALKQEFNTDLHDALTKMPAPDENLKGKIIDVIQKGYYLNDKVIRHSKVVVGE